MGQVKSSASRDEKEHHTCQTMIQEELTRCPIHSSALLKTGGAWESSWSYFHDAIVKGQLITCRKLLSSQLCSTPMCLGSLSPAYRLQQLDTIAYSKLRTTALHMACLYRRSDFVQLLLKHGSEATVMDGFGRTPAALLLEHWPRVRLPPASPPCSSHWEVQSPTSSPPYHPFIPPDPYRHFEHPNHLTDTVVQLWAVPAWEDAEDYAAEGGGGIICAERELQARSGDGRDREMALFREQVTVWRAQSARCLKLLLLHGLGVNDIIDRRRSSTLLHIAARYDLVDVIEMVLNAEREDSSRSAQLNCLPEPCRHHHQSAEDDTDSGHGNVMNCNMKQNISRFHPVMAKDGSTSMPLQMKRAVVRSMRSMVVRSHSCFARWMWNQTRKNRLCEQGRAMKPSGCQRQKSTMTTSDFLQQSGGSSEGGPDGNRDSQSQEPLPRSLADLEVLNATAKTPLAVAIDRGSLNAAHCLMSHGADVFTSDFYGRTILHFLSERDITFDLLMQEVVRQGVDVHHTDNGGNTALHVAAYMGNVSKVRFLLRVGASPDVSNLAGKTPLFLACQRRDPSARHIFLLLLMNSVRFKLRDRLGRLPSLLQREENLACCMLLDHLHETSDNLLRRCVISVRRAIGMERLLDMEEPPCMPCPVSIRKAIFGHDEKSVLDLFEM